MGQSPESDAVITAEIQKSFWGVSFDLNLHITGQVADQAMNHPGFLPSVNSKDDNAPVTFISSFV